MFKYNLNTLEISSLYFLKHVFDRRAKMHSFLEISYIFIN